MFGADVPVAAINEDAHSSAREDQIGTPAGEHGSIDVEASSATVEFAAQGQLGLRVAATYAAHARAHRGIDVGEPRVHCVRMPYSPKSWAVRALSSNT